MASPVADSYTVASGVTIYGGRTPVPPFSASLAITTPAALTGGLVLVQSVGGDIPITGTHSGILGGGIEACFNGGAYQTIVASPTGGTFSGTLTGQTKGVGTLTVRCVLSPSSLASRASVELGDYYLTIGDSNFQGKAFTNAVQPSNATFTSHVFCQGGSSGPQQWKTHTESNVSGNANGYNYPGGLHTFTYPILADPFCGASLFGRLANRIMTAGSPVGFIPSAAGGTTMSDWAPGTDYDTATLLGVACCRVRDTGLSTIKAALLEIGTNTAGITQAQFQTKLSDLVDTIYRLTGAPTIICYCNPLGGDASRAAVAFVLANNAHALAGPDFNQPTAAWASTHYDTTAEINDAGDRLFAAMQSLGFY